MDPTMQLEVTGLARQKALREANALGDSDIQQFYCNRVVFVTGGSGFLGKQLIEKLFRSCQISKVYMLLRSKKGKTMQQRLDDLLKESVYYALREQEPDFADKIVPIEGEVADIKLGINDKDWETLTNEVEAIFHVAATTRFDEPLKVATMINVRGTRECLSLGRACKKLRTFVHISTAYANSIVPLIGCDIDEKFYPAPIPPETLISIAENMDYERLVRISDGLLNEWPNTYSFTKFLADELIRTTSDGLPICIVRPGMVLCSVSEPTPSWIDTSAIYSASGIVTGIGLGVIHTVPVDSNVSLGLVPCDYVNNTVIAAGREAAVTDAKGGNDTKIYAVSPTCRNPITWGTSEKIMMSQRFKIPSPLVIYYPCVINAKNRILFLITTLLFHVIPAYIADSICLLMGKERRFVKLATKIYNMCSAVSYFLRNNWKVMDHNTRRLYENLSKKDKIIFNFDITDINWSDYIVIWALGMRKFLVKDGLRDTDYAMKKKKFLAVVHFGFVTPFYAYVLWKIIYFTFSIAYSLITILLTKAITQLGPCSGQ